MSPFTVNLTLPLFPVFSRLAHISSAKLFDAYEQSLKFLYVMGFPAGVILFALSDRIVTLCFGAAYCEASQVLKILAPVVILLLPTSVYGYVFTALGRQRLYTGCAVAALLSNIGLDLLLIPFYSYIGAAVGTLVAETVLFLSGLVMLQRLGSALAGMSLIWRPCLAALALGSCCWLAKDMILAGVLAGVVGGLVAYVGVLLLLQTFTRQEMALMRNAMRLRLGSVMR